MFGYIRPMQGELKVRELERFKACYCGLCHALGRQYGFRARFILSYEFVFLSMLLWGDGDAPEIKRKRCIASPCRRKKYCAGNDTLYACAGYSVILTWWKLRDAVTDEGFFRAIPYRLASLLLSSAYKKAVRRLPEFDRTVREQLSRLVSIEAAADKSLDETADKFAMILKAAAESTAQEPQRRALYELLYHLGRWVYIIDACDDLKNDVKYGRYNPVALRFQLGGTALTEDSAEAILTTLTHSGNLMSSAFELMPENAWTGIISNIIYLGMPDTAARILKQKE